MAYKTTYWKTRKKAILPLIEENVNDENKEYFIQRVNHKEEKNLRKRLKEVFELAPDMLIQRFLGMVKSKDIQTIMQTCNYFTHRDSNNKYPLTIDDITTLARYTKKLNIILQFYVLKCIGLESEIIEKRLIEYYQNFYSLHSSDNK